MSGMTRPAATPLPTREDVLPGLTKLRRQRQKANDLAAARSALFASEAIFRRALLLADEMTLRQRRVLAARRTELEEMRQRVAALEGEGHD